MLLNKCKRWIIVGIGLFGLEAKHTNNLMTAIWNQLGGRGNKPIIMEGDKRDGHIAKKRKISQNDDQNEVLAHPCRPRAILAKEYTQEVSFVKAYMGKVLDIKSTSRLVKALGAADGLGNDNHLKRVKLISGSQETKEAYLLLCMESALTESKYPTVFELLTSQGVDTSLLGEPELVTVADRAPKTRSQFEVANAYWPVPFHEDKRIRQAMEGKLFTANQLTAIQGHMATALSIGKRATHELQLAHPKAHALAGAVIVDANFNKILAKAADSPGHPLDHAIMRCIAQVAEEQNAAMERRGGKSSPEDDYLCGGYNVFITKEPCPMCSMALVHSRIGRVFWGVGDSDMGGLGGRYYIHTESTLNHHFE
eukprot:Ihof_evm5s58 gene=Ihof_evmTU5s58